MHTAVSLALSILGVAGCGAQAQEQAGRPAAGEPDRTVLPIAEPNYPRETKLDARDAKAPPRFEVKPPKGAPNVIVFLIDDIGFGHASTFGGDIPMPTLDRLDPQPAGADAGQAHAPKDWIAKFKGKFDGGWDKYREEVFARQKQLGIIPQNTTLADKPADIKAWDALSADEKRLFARQMEVFAAFAAHTDHEIGRVVKAIEDLGELDNTLIMYVVGDNGASAEGGMSGMFNEMTYFNGVAESVPEMLKNIDQWGGRRPGPMARTLVNDMMNESTQFFESLDAWQRCPG